VDELPARLRLGELQYNELQAPGGEAVYNHLPGHDNWTPEKMGIVDLCNLRVQLIRALRKVEDELDRRELLDRVT